jgi:hypothetical protein
MGSEIYNLKSLYLDDTVVRGARISTKNASSTRSIEVNPGDEPKVKTGETGINKDYLIQASLVGNDLNGYGTFTNNSEVVRGYTGAQNLSHGDKIKLDVDTVAYTVTGMNATDVYLVEKYTKTKISDPDVQSGSCSIEKVLLDSVKYEKAQENIVYDKDNSEWGVTGIQMSDPVIAPSNTFDLDTGVSLKFQKGTSKKKPDISTVLSTYKTLVSNNTSPILDVSLSPLPYPHSSLQVFMGKNGTELKKAVESQDYIVNYTNGSEILYPIPPYEERDVAYIKFLSSMTDETQVNSIDAAFNGNMTIDKETVEEGTVVVRPVQDILSSEDFTIKVGGSEKTKNAEYLLNGDAGMVTFVEHRNREELIDALAYPKKLIWDGVSVIRGVKEEEVNDPSNLVIPGVSGLKGIDYTIYFEDTDSNNLIRDIDFTIDPESGAFALTSPTKSDEAVLVSYYVEGEDIKGEKVELSTMRLNSFPLIVSSLILTKKYSVLSETGTPNTLSRVLDEGIDYTVSYVTGHIQLMSSNEITVELSAYYTPMAQINCIARSISKSTDYTYTIIDDILSFSQDDLGSKRLIFKVNNPVVSVPKKILFDSDKVDSNYNFQGSITPDNILGIKIKDTGDEFNIAGAKYDDIKKEITLDFAVNNVPLQDTDTVVGSYSFDSDVLPYAPVQLIYTIISAGDDSFLIEGYDKTDTLKAGMVIKVDNKDPQSTNYFVIRDVSYQNQSTKVDIYGTFPENAIDPVFSIFDDQLTWVGMSDDVEVDTTVPVDSDYVAFNGGSLFLKTTVKKDSLLIVNNQEIYTVLSVETQGTRTIVGIYPVLRSTLTSNVKVSVLPIYDTGITTLPASKLILDDVSQPAFSLWYQAPEGFEGSAKILFINNKIVIDEYISGVKNPVSYIFYTTDYQDVYLLAKTIQATASTFRANVPDMGVPDYNPFTLIHANKEDYFLGDGVWDPKALVPFEEEVPVNLPYTFTTTPELYHYTLTELFKGKNEFTIKGADVTYRLVSGMVLAFINKISGRLFFSEVQETKVVSEENTLVSLSSIALEDMVAPHMFEYRSVRWQDLSNKMIGINYEASTLKFQGVLNQNIRVGTLIKIAQKQVYQVQEVIQNVADFDLVLNSELDPEVTIQSYTGYVKISSIPIVLLTPGPQPYIYMTYTAPKKHVGYGRLKVGINELVIKEVVDNFTVKETTFTYSDYENMGMLFHAIRNTESCISGYTPFSVILNNAFEDALRDPFQKYALKSTDDQFVYLSNYIPLTVGAFDIDYSIPSTNLNTYAGTFGVKITSEYFAIKEMVIDSYAEEHEKETIIYYKDTSGLGDLINKISAITSVITGAQNPFIVTALNQDAFGIGSWDVTKLAILTREYLSGDQTIYATVEYDEFLSLGIINEKRMVVGTDYSIDNGVIELVNPVESLDRYLINYMGLDNLYENEGDNITCTCRFVTALPIGYRLDVYMEYINIDQFYIQKLTERKFSEIVTVPQIEQLIEQRGSAGGQGNDSGATNNSVPNYEGGSVTLNYLLQDEYIKKQLYLRFFKWYKQRLRSLSAEMQLGLGFKFGHSNAVGDTDDYYSLDDQYVETEDYTLTRDVDIDQIKNGFSKFFPVEYNDPAPKDYSRFTKEYLSYNEVYCCNITYKDDKNKVVTVGVVKSERPYWNRTNDLIFKVWDDAYINKNLVGYYEVDVPEADRSFYPSNYTFLKIIDSGDRIKIDNFKSYYSVDSIVSPEGKTYEYLITDKAFTDKGIKTYNIVNNAKAPFDTLMENLPPDGYRIWISRQDKEDFPMFDDYGNLGATSYGDSIEGLVKDGRRIKKPFLANLLRLFFPGLSEPTTNFTIMIKRDSEAEWEELGSIDLSKLTFKEERNIDDVMDALRFDFTEKFKVPTIPPVTVYDIKEDNDKGFFRYFYLSLEKIYDAGSSSGYYNGIVIRAKDRKWWFKVVNGGEEPIIGDYGYNPEKVYENFYDPDNIYKKLLLEKQAWQTEELIVRDLYDYSDKIARAFDQGDLNRKNSIYQAYLAMPDGGSVQGISDILRVKIPAYEKQLRFLVDTAGPVFRTLYPDLVHAENEASPEIALTYNQTLYAWNLYKAFYDKYGFYYNLNENNNYEWKNNYIQWVLSMERGIIPQMYAKDMYDRSSRVLTMGLSEIPIIKIALSNQSIYTVVNPTLTVSSTYDGKYLQILFGLVKGDQTISEVNCLVYLYNKSSIAGVPAVVYKSISEVCSDIALFTYEGVNIFTATNIYTHFENDVVSKILYISNQPISPEDGFDILTTNVADHRDSDPRILFLNKYIEDRVYTHEIRELPGFKLGYNGEYYLLKHGVPGLNIMLRYDPDKANLRYGVFYDETGHKVLNITYDYEGKPQYHILKLYNKSGDTYSTKTIIDLSYEISRIEGFSTEFTNNSYRNTCDSFIPTTDYVDTTYMKFAPYITTDAAYSSVDQNVDQFDYRVYKDSVGIKKMDIIFYNLILDGSRVYRATTVSDTFTFSFQKSDASFKSLSELCSEISNFKYKGEKIFSASSVYEAEPKSDLSTTFVLADSKLYTIGYDWEATLYIDTYVEAISGKDANSLTVSNIKNAVFSFPMYTANGNPNKNAIEDIPVSGSWVSSNPGDILELSCIDGFEWSVSFSDYDSGDYKSYMTPQDVIDTIDKGIPLTEAQYALIKSVEDKPIVAVLKELVLTRIRGTEKSEARFNLRQYKTLNELIEAVVLSRFNDSGELDTNGGRAFFSAKLIGSPTVEGLYSSNELAAIYTPVIRSFSVKMDDGSTKYMMNHLIGWEISYTQLKGNIKHRLKMSERRYSYGQTQKFVMSEPSTAYTDILYNYPQGFRRDILAFNIYSWDYNARYEIRDNWLYFKSDSIDYSKIIDFGQPIKTLGYGIPLAGSGHPMTNSRESILDLINRINDNNVLNKAFHANLKFTRDTKDNPGYFEYNYLPNFKASVPKSTLDHIMLKDDSVLTVKTGNGYVFTSSNITVDDASDTLSVSCDWKFDYVYESVFFFNDISCRTIDGLTSSINSALAPVIPNSLILAVLDPDAHALSGSMSRNILPTFVSKPISASGSDLKIKVSTIGNPTQVTAIRISIRALTGSNFTVNSASYIIPQTRDRLIIRCGITYNGTYAGISGYDLRPHTFGSIADFISSVTPYAEDTFTPLFSASILNNSFRDFDATRLLDTSVGVTIAGVDLSAKLSDIVGFRVLNMAPKGTLNVYFDNSVEVITFKTYSKNLGGDTNIHNMVESVMGDYTDGFLSCDVLPSIIPSIIRGRLDAKTYSLVSNNTPAPVYFGVLGDIKFVQISDKNLHTQYNYIKERLGMPWRDEQGNLKYDYYTPENYNENNPCAIDVDNFLGYLRSGRYNQIKNSMVNESIVSNKYLWLYMKFHKEFGCDQRANTLKDAIEKGNTDIETLGQVL